MAELSGTGARVELLRRGVTAVDGRSVLVLGAGQFNNAFLLEDRVVRVPKSQHALDGLRREVKFLASARALLDAEVPSFLEEKLGEGPNYAYVVHRFIPGQVVREPWLGEMPIDDLNRIASAVARFLRSLRALTSTWAADVLERTNLDSWWRQLIAGLEADVTPHLKPHVGTRMIADLRTAAPAVVGTPVVVCHGDLGGNLLWGPDGLGVIDFASCSIAHPAVDLASLLVLGDRFAEALFSADPSLAESLDVARRIRRTFLAQDLLWSVRQGDLERVAMISAGL